MILSAETLSFTKWAEILRSRPLFAALSGFAGCTPGIGAFYDFSGRLLSETTGPIIRQAIFKPKDSDKDRPPRNSKAWKKAYKDRTSADRSHKRKKIDFHLEQARLRSRRQCAVRIFLMAICQHALVRVDLFEQSFD
jgi:hypothetical protein